MKNLDIRQVVEESGLKYGAIAREMGISAAWLSRLLKKDLSSDDKIRIFNAIAYLSGKKVKQDV